MSNRLQEIMKTSRQNTLDIAEKYDSVPATRKIQPTQPPTTVVTDEVKARIISKIQVALLEKGLL